MKHKLYQRNIEFKVQIFHFCCCFCYFLGILGSEHHMAFHLRFPNGKLAKSCLGLDQGCCKIDYEWLEIPSFSWAPPFIQSISIKIEKRPPCIPYFSWKFHYCTRRTFIIVTISSIGSKISIIVSIAHLESAKHCAR